jgi:hypothetical protein
LEAARWTWTVFGSLWPPERAHADVFPVIWTQSSRGLGSKRVTTEHLTPTLGQAAAAEAVGKRDFCEMIKGRAGYEHLLTFDGAR